ncbi:sushi domain-containing protein 2-like [Plakobranchus ocellatus]|uniref:Sushi domain-containing protein 2-like n=1 Tax=Plakobranchus ocellatus TaxID=259542 RepID=A0AAV3XUG8_9GAST|nr:sushi domain-containing protein 2-like [Plakobranchus ocellatus]
MIDIPTNFQEAPTSEDVESVCGDDQSCKWDYRITGSAKVAKATKEADEVYKYIQASIQQQDSCGLPEVGRNAVMDTYDFSEGSRITVTGCGEGMSFSGNKEFQCVKEPRSEAERLDRADYGLVKTDEGDGVEYIIHWLPKPSTLCTEDDDDDNDVYYDDEEDSGDELKTMYRRKRKSRRKRRWKRRSMGRGKRKRRKRRRRRKQRRNRKKKRRRRRKRKTRMNRRKVPLFQNFLI